MQYRVPKWLKAAIDSGPWGFQADLARRAGIAPDKLSKVMSGARALKHEEAESLQEAIRTMQTAAAEEPDDSKALAPPQGSGVVRRVIANKPSRDQAPELVFLLNNGGYFVFQLDARVLAELRAALEQIEPTL